MNFPCSAFIMAPSTLTGISGAPGTMAWKSLPLGLIGVAAVPCDDRSPSRLSLQPGIFELLEMISCQSRRQGLSCGPGHEGVACPLPTVGLGLSARQLPVPVTLISIQTCIMETLSTQKSWPNVWRSNAKYREGEIYPRVWRAGVQKTSDQDHVGSLSNSWDFMTRDLPCNHGISPRTLGP